MKWINREKYTNNCETQLRAYFLSRGILLVKIFPKIYDSLSEQD